MKRISLLVALVAPLAFAAQASASFHLMKVSEVLPGGSGFVELQMYAQAQDRVSGHSITIYGPTGTPVEPFTFPANAPNGENQRTILVGDTDDPVAGSDFTYPLLEALSGTAGAVCFETVDCVAWGTFNTSVLPAGSNVGNPGPPIPAGSSLSRSIAGGCATLLEPADDTGDSAADFDLTPTPTPRSNAVAPTETECAGEPETIINKGPRKQSTKTKAKFKFSSPDPVTGFECSLDGKAFKSCSSPRKYKRLKRKRHEFEVRAVNAAGADPSPATYKWKVREPKG